LLIDKIAGESVNMLWRMQRLCRKERLVNLSIPVKAGSGDRGW
jgi:hypothetical protein